MSNDEQHWLSEIREDAASLLFGGWVNETTGRGDPDRDKNAASTWAASPMLQPYLLRSLFEKNALARAICTALPEWGLRNGWDLTMDTDAVESRRIESAVRAELARLGAHEALLRGAIWGQTFGGGLILVGADDGRGTGTPLDISRLASVRFLRVVSRANVDVENVFADPLKPGFGEPSLYKVRESVLRGTGQETTLWHASRVIAFPGIVTEEETKRDNNLWDESILDVVVRDLLKHDAMWDDTGGMMADGSQGVWKIQGLMKAVSSGLETAIRARFKLAEQSRSLFRSLLLDAEKEDFQYVHRQFSGISDLLGQSVIRTAGAAQIPATVLMGQAPAGLNATGESDLELWYARVRAYQTGVAVSRVRRLFELVMSAKEGPTAGRVPPAWSVSLADARSLTPMQRAELEARKAQVDTAMITARVIRPEEVAVNRYGADGWSGATTIELDWRRKRLADPEVLEVWLAEEPGAVETGVGGDPAALPAIGPAEGKEAAQNPKTGAPE